MWALGVGRALSAIPANPCLAPPGRVAPRHTAPRQACHGNPKCMRARPAPIDTAVGRNPKIRPEAVERGRAVARRNDSLPGAKAEVAELQRRAQAVRNVVVGLLSSPDARTNVWRDHLHRILRLLDGDARA